MSDQSKVEKNFGMAWPVVFPDVTENLQAQMQTLLEDQKGLLEESQKVMAAWTKRGQATMEEGIRTFQAACACKDPAALATLYGDWLRNGMTRMLADMNETREEVTRLAEIGQKSATALFQRSVDAAASSASPFTVAKVDSGQTKDASRGETAHKTPVRTAAE